MTRAETPALLPAPSQSEPPPAPRAPAAGRPNQARSGAKELSRQRIEQAMQRQLQLAQRALQDMRYEDAVRNFSIAYAFSPAAQTLRGIAESARKAERHAEALLLYERLRGEPLDPASRQEADERIKTLRGILMDEDIDGARIVRDHIDQARRSFQNRKYDEAIRSYAMAYALKRLPRLLFNMAQAERRARSMVEAYLMYERLLQEEPGSQVRSEAEGYLAELRPIVNKPPVHKQPWFWSILAGSAAATAVAIGLGAGLSQSGSQREPTLQLTFPLQSAR